jgi:hypothetical protein
MAAKVKVGMIDHSGEACGPSFYVDDADAPDYTGADTAAGLIATAMNVLTDCGFTRTTLSAVLAAANDAPPSTVTAQREVAIRVGYKDTVTGRHEQFDIPGPATTFYPATGTDVIPLDNIIAAAFIAVFEANAVSLAGNPVEVTSIRLVGRNN